jgi:hypothetical protein
MRIEGPCNYMVMVIGSCVKWPLYVMDEGALINTNCTCEWYVLRCGSKNGHQEDICSKEVELHAQNILTTSSSIVNDVHVYDHFMSRIIITLIFPLMTYNQSWLTPFVMNSEVLNH